MNRFRCSLPMVQEASVTDVTSNSCVLVIKYNSPKSRSLNELATSSIVSRHIYLCYSVHW